MLEIRAPTRTQESVPADLCEGPWQHVREKAREKAVDGQGERACGMRPSVRILKCDAAVRKALQAAIREGDAIDIARQVQRRVLARPDRFHVHRPAPLPDASIRPYEQPGAGQCISHLRAKVWLDASFICA